VYRPRAVVKLLREGGAGMAKILNSEFQHSPLAVSLDILSRDVHGWLGFRLLMTSDHAHTREVASCTGQLSSDDYRRLSEGLQRLNSGNLDSLSFSPTEPSFLLRINRLQNSELEFLWVVDQGAIEADYSTDTGIGILMTVQPKGSQDLLAELAREVAAVSQDGGGVKRSE
jgi:hypothetical protein